MTNGQSPMPVAACAPAHKGHVPASPARAAAAERREATIPATCRKGPMGRRSAPPGGTAEPRGANHPQTEVIGWRASITYPGHPAYAPIQIPFLDPNAPPSKSNPQGATCISVLAHRLSLLVCAPLHSWRGGCRWALTVRAWTPTMSALIFGEFRFFVGPTPAPVQARVMRWQYRNDVKAMPERVPAGLTMPRGQSSWRLVPDAARRSRPM